MEKKEEERKTNEAGQVDDIRLCSTHKKLHLLFRVSGNRRVNSALNQDNGYVASCEITATFPV